jgi:hypothetical protein
LARRPRLWRLRQPKPSCRRPPRRRQSRTRQSRR